MLFDCHTHTSLHSSCSSLRPEELCTLAQERGLDGVVITEHRYQWRAEAIATLRSLYPALGIYSGVELSLREGYDVICVSGEVRLDLPDFPFLAQLERELRHCRDEVFTFVAHPFRYRDYMTPELEDVFSVVEGIEVNSVNIVKNAPGRLNGRFVAENHTSYEQACERFSLVPLYNSDAHAAVSVATIANDTQVQELPRTTAELSALLRQDVGREWQNVNQLEACLERYLL